MGDRTNTIVSKTFNYDLPDDYLHQTNTDGLIGSFTYNGPNKIWVFINNDSRKLVSALYYTEKDDGDLIPTPEGQTKVCVTAEYDPVVISMIVDQGYITGPTKEETLPDGSIYERLNSPPPDHTYELEEIEYDLEEGKWIKPFPWKKPHMTWETLKSARNSMLRESDMVIRNNVLSPADLEALEQYRQKLRDIPSVFAGVDPWKVPFPNMPLNINGVG